MEPTLSGTSRPTNFVSYASSGHLQTSKCPHQSLVIYQRFLAQPEEHPINQRPTSSNVNHLNHQNRITKDNNHVYDILRKKSTWIPQSWPNFFDSSFTIDLRAARASGTFPASAMASEPPPSLATASDLSLIHI